MAAVAEGEAVWEAGGLIADIKIPIPGIGTSSISKDDCLHLPIFLGM